MTLSNRTVVSAAAGVIGLLAAGILTAPAAPAAGTARHTGAADVSVELAGTATEGITVEVGNARPVSPTSASTLPASGLGLIGLAERVSLAGGRFTHGTDTTGGYAVRAWIPWDS